jgi:phosphoribosyl 1,2-cyclic phosphodiesterase
MKQLDIKALASGSTGNCYIVSDSNTTIMIECGISITRIKKGCGFKLHEIQGCLVSHEH